MQIVMQGKIFPQNSKWKELEFKVTERWDNLLYDVVVTTPDGMTRWVAEKLASEKISEFLLFIVP